MKINIQSIKSRFIKVQEAYSQREYSQQISARTAKLASDITSGKLTLTDVLAKSIALYLRRQKHLYGDDALNESVDEILAFVSELGDIQDLLDSNNIKSLSFNNDRDVIHLYQDMGIYGLIQLIEIKGKELSRQKKAAKILEFSKTLKKNLSDYDSTTQFAEVALSLDSSEPTHRLACWLVLNDGNFQYALDLFCFIFYFNKKILKSECTDDSLYKIFVEKYGKDFLETFLSKNEESFEQKLKTHSIKKYRNRFILTNRVSPENILLEMLDEWNIDTVISFIETDPRFNNKVKATIALRTAKITRTKLNEDKKYKLAIEKLADYALTKDKSEGVLRNVYFSYQKINAHDKSAEVIELLKAFAGDKPTIKQRKLIWSSPKYLIKLVEQVPAKLKQPAYEPVKGRVCYIIHNSLPYSSGGYATRGHGLLTGLIKKGVDIYAVTRPGYPHDISQHDIKDIKPQDLINGVLYKRILYPSRREYSNYEYMLKAVDSYVELFKKDKPQLVVAASNHLDGLPAMFAARKMGIAFIYEIRGFWEVTRLSKYPEFKENPMFEVEKKLEALVADHADHIFTLTQGMVDELNSRDVDTTGKITLLPNSCNVEIFNPRERDSSLAKELKIPSDVAVIGYVGTLVSYEGLDDLALACAELKKRSYKFRLLIVGNENATGQGKGSIVKQIEQIAQDSGYNDWLIMPGRVPFEQVEKYYSLIDVAPFPRKAWPVCEIVPPMKTLEALSMKKAVLVSSNKALTEMITHDVNGRIFERGDINDLTEQLEYLLDHQEKWQGYGEQGRVFVEQERTWKQTSEKAEKVINQLLANN